MNIIVVGLGLIGGSFCKAIAKYAPEHTCWGMDTDQKTIRQALEQGAIQKEATPQDLHLADLTIVCLHPRQTIAFLREHLQSFAKGSIVTDSCGIKEAVMSLQPDYLAAGVFFVGAHPMAGREFSGYAYAQENLYQNASFIVTPGNAPGQAVEQVEALALQLGFGKVVETTAQEHDQIIAYTSQLAHIVSNAYVKSPSLLKERGFSAGSFLDLTRVAKLNEDMWTDLFILNNRPLLEELDTIISHLNQYRNALAAENSEHLKVLLREGRVRKEQSLQQAT